MRARTACLVLLSTVSVIAASSAGCGDDDSGVTPTGDGGPDTSSSSSSSSSGGPGPDAAPTDDGGNTNDAGGCGAEGSACQYNGQDGLCKGGVCVGCTDKTDDPACKSAYASTFPNGAICAASICVAGNCHANADCTGGQICGLSVPNTCSKCASDAECKTSYGNDYVCNTTTGGCVTNAMACTAVGSACSNNASEICCSTTGGGNTCATGTCCSASDCKDATKPNCINRVCTGCPAVTDGQYYVDPTVADDSSATGGPTCPFKTITKALSIIGNPAAAATINVKANATVSAGETFPLILPANISVKGDTTQPATVNVAAGSIGFVLRGTTSGLSYLVIDGQTQQATSGISVQTGTSSTTTMVQHVTVKNMKTDGIVVQDATGATTGGAVALGPAVVSTGNGTGGATANGLLVKNHGVAVVTGAVGAESHFDSNTDSGIKVLDSGQLTVTGVIGATPLTTGTVTANKNANAGLWIQQTPAATVPANMVTGLTAWQTSGALTAGIHVFGGSSLKLRSSSSLANAYGVYVSPFINGTTITSDVSKIDLGTSPTADPGKNVLQDKTGGNPNTSSGVCLAVTAGVGAIVNAQGNTFVSVDKTTSVDCSLAAPPAIGENTTCANGQSVGVLGNAVNTNSIATQACAQQHAPN